MLCFESNIDTDSSFNTRLKAGDGKVFVQAVALSGITADTPMLLQFGGSGFAATAISACTNECGYCGVPVKAVASGCVGWVQIRGKCVDTQGALSSWYTGSEGHAICMAATATDGGLFATTSANQMLGVSGQVGVLLEETDNSTTATIWLTGTYAKVLDLG